MRLALLFLLALLAQAQSTIQIITEEDRLVVGRSMPLRAIVRDAQGAVLNGAAITWSVNRPNDAAITPDGVLSARGLATVRVVARSGNVSAESPIQFFPARVEMTPGESSLTVGETLQFRPIAYDANNEPIANVTWAWFLVNSNLGTSQLGRVTNQGMLTATGEGRLLVRAMYSWNETVVGQQRSLAVFSPITVSAPKTYQLRRLFHTGLQWKSNFELRARPSMIWSTDDGELYFNASLSGISNGLVCWKDGLWSPVSMGGQPRTAQNALSTEFRSHSITRTGRILTYEETNIAGNQLNTGRRDDLRPYVNVNTPLGETEGTNSIVITRNSMTDSGWVLLRATFRYLNNPITYTGLFRGLGDDIYDLVVSTADSVEGIPNGFSIDGDFGIANDGTAYYSLTQGANRVFYRHRAAARRTELVRTGT
jgi:hypothetical protein